MAWAAVVMTRVVEYIRTVGSAGFWHTGDVAEPVWPGSTLPENSPVTVATGTPRHWANARLAWPWAATGATGGRAGWAAEVLGIQPTGRSFWRRLMLAARAASTAWADRPGTEVAVVLELLSFFTTK